MYCQSVLVLKAHCEAIDSENCDSIQRLVAKVNDSVVHGRFGYVYRELLSFSFVSVGYFSHGALSYRTGMLWQSLILDTRHFSPTTRSRQSFSPTLQDMERKNAHVSLSLSVSPSPLLPLSVQPLSPPPHSPSLPPPPLLSLSHTHTHLFAHNLPHLWVCTHAHTHTHHLTHSNMQVHISSQLHQARSVGDWLRHTGGDHPSNYTTKQVTVSGAHRWIQRRIVSGCGWV